MDKETELIWEAHSEALKSHNKDPFKPVFDDPTKYELELFYTPDMDYDGNHIERQKGYVRSKDGEEIGEISGQDLDDLLYYFEKSAPDNIEDPDGGVGGNVVR